MSKVLFAVLGGTVIGAVAGYFWNKKEVEAANTVTFEEIRQEKVEEAPADPEPKEEPTQEEKPKAKRAKKDVHLEEKKDILETAKELAEEPPVSYSKPRKGRPKKPYVIPPEELGEMEDYETITLTYFADGTLTDDDYKVIEQEEADDIIGPDALSHFGEYEDDSVCIRNEKYKCDYEILNDLREYEEVLKENPYLSED